MNDLLIHILIEMSLEPQPSNVLIQTAGRMAYAIGLHKKLDETGLSEAEIDQRRNVFWIAYIIDKALALRLGVPGVMHDNDIGIDLPKEHRMFSVDLDSSRSHDIFQCQVQLALLRSRIYTELYSAKAQQKSALDRLRSVGQLDKDLQDWRMTLPLEIRPDEVIRCSQEQIPPVFLMHFAFFDCICTIHRISLHFRGPWTKEDPTQIASLHSPQLNPRVYSSQSICLAAARSTIKLLQYVDVVDRFRLDKFIWSVVPDISLSVDRKRATDRISFDRTEFYYPLSAFLLLFANIIQNPEDPSSADDLQLMDLVDSIMIPMIGYAGPYSSSATLQLSRKLRNLAKDFVANRSDPGMRKTKREPDSDLPKDALYAHEAVIPQPVSATSWPPANGAPGLVVRFSPL